MSGLLLNTLTVDILPEENGSRPIAAAYERFNLPNGYSNDQ